YAGPRPASRPARKPQLASGCLRFFDSSILRRKPSARSARQLFAVQRFDLITPALLDDLALDLQRGGQLSRLNAECGWERRDTFDAFELRQVAIECVDNLLVEREDVRPGDQFGSRARRAAQIL